MAWRKGAADDRRTLHRLLCWRGTETLHLPAIHTPPPHSPHTPACPPARPPALLTPARPQERDARGMMEIEMQKAQEDKAKLAATASAREEQLRERQRSSIAMTGSARPGTGSRRKFGL